MPVRMNSSKCQDINTDYDIEKKKNNSALFVGLSIGAATMGEYGEFSRN